MKLYRVAGGLVNLERVESIRVERVGEAYALEFDISSDYGRVYTKDFESQGAAKDELERLVKLYGVPNE